MKKRILSVATVIVAFILMLTISLSNNQESSLQKRTYDFLTENGLSSVQACGIMAAIECESQFDSAATNFNQTNYGLLQWSFQRKDQLEAFAKTNGKSIDDFETQLAFLIEELNPQSEVATYQLLSSYKGYELSDWLNAKTPEQASRAFCMLYERPGLVDLEVRDSLAQKFYNEFNGNSN